MGNIKIMDAALASRVCAGEVITRPVNAVKELVENSIDAGADRVRVELLNGGKRSILVSDNGSGMNLEDLRLCLKRHATSKISSMADFASLRSYGFRGEALASMSAVSKIRIDTRPREQECGYQVAAQGDREEEPVAVPREPGTTIELRDLFHTIPARLRFLKSDQYEKSLVVDLIQSFMAIYPEISFELFHHGDRVLYSSGDGQSSALFSQILGLPGDESLIEIPPAQHPILKMKVQGFLTGPTLTRSSSRHLRVFVNHRIVKHSPLTRAIIGAYDSLLGHKRWPLGFIFVEVPPRMIDANVHPMKTEVRIENESILEEFITKKIRAILLKSDLSTPLGKESLFQKKEAPLSSTLMEPLKTSLPLAGCQPSLGANFPSKAEPSPPPRSISAQNTEVEVAPGLAIAMNPRARTFLETAAPELRETEKEIPKEVSRPSQILNQKDPPESLPLDQLEIIGQLDSTFIIGSHGENMVLIDQHVAQERVLFEEYLSRMRRKCTSTTQSLLVPVKLRLDSRALGILDEAREPLKNLGFHMETDGEELIIKGVPDIFSSRLDPEFIEDVVSGFEKGLGSDRLEDYFRDVAAMMACKGSVKAGDDLGFEEMQVLLSSLSRCENPYSCPHGRPIVVKISLREICSRFQRPYVSKKLVPCQH